MTITSPHNEKLKEIRKLVRQRRAREHAGRFVAEGEDLLAAADVAGWTAVERLCAAGSGLDGVEVEPELLASVSSLGSGTRALAVYEERWAGRPVGPVCVYLHGVGDPGNVGTVLRSAEAFGVSCVAVGPGTADPFGPKAVRASMGAVFSVPLVRVSSVGELPGVTIALVAGQGLPLARLGIPLATGVWEVTHAEDPKFPKATLGGGAGKASEAGLGGGASDVTLMVGSERDGLPDAVVKAADMTAHIPIKTHSLNAAMAATVALYELTRSQEF